MLRWTLLIMIVLALSACNGSSTVQPGPQPVADGQEQVLEALPRAPSEVAEVSGRITVEGLTLVPDEGTTTVPSTPARPMAKIIDPGDDILVARPTDPNGGFKFELDRELRGIFEIELRVEEDLNGDGVTPDVLIQRLPLHLVLGRSAVLNVTLRRGVPTAPGSDTAGSADPVFFPGEDGGELVLVDIALADAAGSKSVFLGRRPDGTVAYDANGNRFIELGNDRVFPDATNSGWPDGSEMAFADATASFRHDGIVAGVDVVGRTLTVRTTARQDFVVQVDPFAAIQTLSAAGDVLGQLVLEQSLIGRQVQVSGLSVGNVEHANLIVVLPEQQLAR